MKQRVVVSLVAVVSVIILAFIGYAILSPAQTPGNSALPPIENAEHIYTKAASKIDPTLDTILRISLTREMTVDGSVFLEVSERTVQYDVQPSGQKYIQLQETLTSGTHRISVSEIFSDDVVYLTVNDTPFLGTCSAEQYEQTLIPAIILDAELYDNISGIDTGNGYTIHFSEPVGTEKWLADESETLLEARGSASVSYNGDLQDSMYTASYQKNGITFRTTVHVKSEQKNIAIVRPEDTTLYTQISYWQGPKILERACGYLIQADSVSASYNDSIYFQAIGDHRTQDITLHAYNDGKWSMRMTTNVTLRNDTKQEQETTYTKDEHFLDNEYSVSTDNDVPTTNTGITVDAVHNYFQDQLVSTVILPHHISSCDVVEKDNVLRIYFTGTDALGDFLAENACQILYQNPDLIADTGAEINAESLQCYLEINKFSGLPVASGINFSGSYKAEGIPYRLQYSADQAYIVPSSAAKTEIEKAAGK